MKGATVGSQSFCFLIQTAPRPIFATRSQSGRPLLTDKLRDHRKRALNCARRRRSHATRVV